MSNFINDNIIINFTISKLLQNTIQEAEEADFNKDIIEFSHIAAAIDIIAKECVASGTLTKEQWDLLILKYPEFP